MQKFNESLVTHKTLSKKKCNSTTKTPIKISKIVANKVLINLAKLNLSPDVSSVLKLALNHFSSTSKFNKNNLAQGVLRFVRRYKLKEYFFEKNNVVEYSKIITTDYDEDSNRICHNLINKKIILVSRESFIWALTEVTRISGNLSS